MDLALGVGIPLGIVALFYLLKVNATALFFIVCGAALLFDRGTKNVENILQTIVPNLPQAKNIVVPILVALPVVIGVLMQVRYGKKWLFVQLVPAILTGMLAYILAARIMSYLYDMDFRSGVIWKTLSRHEDVVIAVGMFASLIGLPIAGKGGGHHEKHGKHH